ncbi:hypothetical protein M885DRAFT_513182 [Pelagophyceae sp. CCMP2097]|nr:hypothetical protein M885DRAFT_513182 [Pelagophyceae sp. CCMP2097]
MFSRRLSLVALAAACSAFAPLAPHPRHRAVVRLAEAPDGTAAAEASRSRADEALEGLERHPALFYATAERTAELLEDDRPMNSDSFAGKLESFFVGIVRHPVMLWNTALRTMELLEEELETSGGKAALDKAATIRELRIAAEAVRDSRRL